MKNKRGQGISMEFIIIAALALIALIVIVLFFTGSLGRLSRGTTDTVNTATDQQKDMWAKECALSCTTGGKNPNFYCTHEFQVKNDKDEVFETWVCNSGKHKSSGTISGKEMDLAVQCEKAESGCIGSA